MLSRWRLFYHVVWATKDREPSITIDRESTVHQHLHEIVERHDGFVRAIGGTDDHVHMAVSIPPTIPISDAVHRITGATSRSINREFGGGFRWQPDYSIDSFSERPLGRVVDYIANQRRHHADGLLWDRIEPPAD